MLKKIIGLSLIFVSILSVLPSPSYALEKSLLVSPQDIIKPEQEAQYFEKWLGVIEVGTTKKKYLELYTGQGETIKKIGGEVSYYYDKKNYKTLIVETNLQDIIEVVTYINGIQLPPGFKSVNDVKSWSKINIKNLMTSMGSRMGYSPARIMSAYGRPSVEIYLDKNEREFKYIMLGNLHPKLNFVYLEYSFLFKNNKVSEIRIENGR